MLETVDEVAIKYESQLYVDPVARLCLGICSSILPSIAIIAETRMTGSQIICHLFYVKALYGVINGVII